MIMNQIMILKKSFKKMSKQNRFKVNTFYKVTLDNVYWSPLKKDSVFYILSIQPYTTHNFPIKGFNKGWRC